MLACHFLLILTFLLLGRLTLNHLQFRPKPCILCDAWPLPLLLPGKVLVPHPDYLHHNVHGGERGMCSSASLLPPPLRVAEPILLPRSGKGSHPFFQLFTPQSAWRRERPTTLLSKLRRLKDSFLQRALPDPVLKYCSSSIALF